MDLTQNGSMRCFQLLNQGQYFIGNRLVRNFPVEVDQLSIKPMINPRLWSDGSRHRSGTSLSCSIGC